MALGKRAWQQGEIPVGAVLVNNQQLLGWGCNQPIQLHDPSAHAEMQAIRMAGQRAANYRLLDTTLYVTLEPCPMCAGLLIHSRIQRLVFGAFDYKSGAAGSLMNLLADSRLNHQVEVVSGILGEQCGQMLSAFFAERRTQKKRLKQLGTVGVGE